MDRIISPPAGWQVCWTAIRPHTLPLAAAPVFAGSALAWAEAATPHWGPAGAALLAALLIQIGTNLHNDAADYENGNDRADRVGPLRVTAAGWASPIQVKRGAALVFLLALLLGLYLVAVGGWPILAIGSASLLAASAYSGGRHPISHTPFGELCVWIFFGLLAVGGSYYLQAGQISAAAWLTGAATGLPAAAVLMVNNLRDRITDSRAGRRTLAALLGDRGGRRAYAAMLLLPQLLLIGLAGLGQPGASLAWLTLPEGLRLIRRIGNTHGAAFNPLLAHTARYALFFATLLASGTLLFRWII